MLLLASVLLLAAALLSAVDPSWQLVCAAKPRGSTSSIAEEPQYYFWNEITGEVQWEDPGDVAYEDEAGIRFWIGPSGEKLSEEPNSHGFAWVEYYSEDLQRAYYFNQETKETTWARPEDLAWRRVPVKRPR